MDNNFLTNILHQNNNSKPHPVKKTTSKQQHPPLIPWQHRLILCSESTSPWYQARVEIKILIDLNWFACLELTFHYVL